MRWFTHVYPISKQMEKKGQKRGFEMILSHLNITQPTHPELWDQQLSCVQNPQIMKYLPSTPEAKTKPIWLTWPWISVWIWDADAQHPKCQAAGCLLTTSWYQLMLSYKYHQIIIKYPKVRNDVLQPVGGKREILQCILGNHAHGSGDSSGWSLANSEVRTPRSSPSAISFAAEHHTTKMTTLDCLRKRETPNWRLFMVASPFQTDQNNPK
jgi:hypothetical protein